LLFRNFIHVERRGVGGEDGAWFGDFIQLGKDLLLESHVFENSLHHQVRFAKTVVGERGTDAGHPLFHGLLGEAALLHGIDVILSDCGQPAIERGLIGFLKQHGNARVSEDHGDATAHSSRADDRDVAHRDLRDVFRNARDFRDVALAEEDMDQGLGLIGKEAFLKQFRLALYALFEGKLGGGLDGVDGSERRH
jgi:hypothetical protein